MQSIWHASPDPIALARALRERLGAVELYLADLDAIAGHPPALELYHTLSALGLTLWVDAGARELDCVQPLFDAGVGVVILGLETLRGPLLRRVGSAHHPGSRQRAAPTLRSDSYAFSLDLRGGRPLVPTAAAWGTSDPQRLAHMAIEAGLRRVIVLDLARVGTGQGLGTLSLLAALRTSHPDIELIAGGGIAGLEDLRVLNDLGLDAVLVGSALHDGRLGFPGPCVDSPGQTG